MSEKERAFCRNRNIGFVFQSFHLIHELSALDNVRLSIQFYNLHEKKKIPGRIATERSREVLMSLGMEQHIHKRPMQLSGGQKQRVSIAGVLAMHPKCIVLDEPTAMLDPKGRKEVIRAIRALNQVEEITVILITHYMEEIIHADKVFVMDSGRIVMDGTPREIFSQVEKLKSLRLDVPQATLLGYELQRRGVRLPSGLLTAEELADALGQSLGAE